jgi:hypothetical protein
MGAILICARQVTSLPLAPRRGLALSLFREGRSCAGAASVDRSEAHHSAAGATGWSRNPARSSARRTLPDALASSRNALT